MTPSKVRPIDEDEAADVTYTNEVKGKASRFCESIATMRALTRDVNPDFRI